MELLDLWAAQFIDPFRGQTPPLGNMLNCLGQEEGWTEGSRQHICRAIPELPRFASSWPSQLNKCETRGVIVVKATTGFK
jgi:hypothetical protein